METEQNKSNDNPANLNSVESTQNRANINRNQRFALNNIVPSAGLAFFFMGFFMMWGGLQLVRAFASETISIEGYVYADNNLNGVFDLEDSAWEGQGVWLVRRSTGEILGSTLSDSSGQYRFVASAGDEYQVRYSEGSWTEIKRTWRPTTIDGVWPISALSPKEGKAYADFGWRPIKFNSVEQGPISEYDDASGLKVKSYTDSLSAQQISEYLKQATQLNGEELTSLTLTFALYEGGFCSAGASGSPGSYQLFYASCSIGYDAWLATRQRQMCHEYGHAWSEYHRTIVNQQANWDLYLTQRGIQINDSRLGSSYAWAPEELIAEDYRQLFCVPEGAKYAQVNQDIPLAKDVSGLKEYLSGEFMNPSNPPGDGTPEPEPADTEPPTVPSNLKAAPTATPQINLSWSASTDNVAVEGYRIFRNGSQIAAIPTSSSPVYNDSGVSSGSSYSYNVRAYDAAGNVSASSSTVSATVPVAQSTFSISGIVKDHNGNPVPGATIAMGKGRWALKYTTNSQGYYYIPQLEPGDYELTYSATNFSDQKHTIVINSEDVIKNISLTQSGDKKGNSGNGGGKKPR